MQNSPNGFGVADQTRKRVGFIPVFSPAQRVERRVLGITRRKNLPLRLERPDASFTFWENGHIFSLMTVDADGYPPAQSTLLSSHALERMVMRQWSAIRSVRGPY